MDYTLPKDYATSALEYRMATLERRTARLSTERQEFLAPFFTEHPPSSDFL